jgi:hypothetical protein
MICRKNYRQEEVKFYKIWLPKNIIILDSIKIIINNLNIMTICKLYRSNLLDNIFLKSL